MSFHEIRFPPRISFGSVGGPERLTEIVTMVSGREERNTPWKHSRRRYDAGIGVRSLDDISELVSFFEARSGRLYGFRWKDWTDYKSCLPSETPRFTDQDLGLGDGSTTTFQMSKAYRSGGHTYSRPIRKPIRSTVKVGIDDAELVAGTDYEVDTKSGEVSFEKAPRNGVRIRVGFEFDVPVRFDTDTIMTSISSIDAGEIPNVPIVELKL